MLLHNLLDFVRKSRRQLKIRRGEIEEEPAGHALYLRMTVSERLQHGALALSFILLVITGLHAALSRGLVGARHPARLTDRVFDAAQPDPPGLGRRHGRGEPLPRRLPDSSRPAAASSCAISGGGGKDLRDAIATLKYNIGLSGERPEYDRFSYIEKSEYWALVWGTLVMAVTGIVMWFDNTFIRLLTKLGYDVSRTIHFYEAWLATLAILVWHFYFVIFNPDVYPMNMSWLNGRLTEREMEEEHPLELERILEPRLPAGALHSTAKRRRETR